MIQVLKLFTTPQTCDACNEHYLDRCKLVLMLGENEAKKLCPRCFRSMRYYKAHENGKQLKV